jgi:hypothetical protein
MMNGKIVAACAAAALAFGPSQALAWGAEGHQYIGNLASALLTPNAAQHVQAILGPQVNLASAAVWPDCIRSVSGSPGSLSYNHNLKTPAACDVFGNTPAEKARMEDYAERNWTNCEYAGHLTQCNFAYHFADVGVQHDHYDRSYFGTNDHDVVSAIQAAILVLQGQPAPAPFNIKDQKEALLLLAHFVGDVHQPLHVGAVYVDSTGAVIDPDAVSTTQATAAETTGGNWLAVGTSNLHSRWDAIPTSWGTAPTHAVIKAAQQTPSVGGPLVGRPVIWASETVVAAQDAYQNMSFQSAGQPQHWKVTFTNPSTYTSHERTVQRRQLTKAGARLAEVLNTIWP